jgi:hypothetical protein
MVTIARIDNPWPEIVQVLRICGAKIDAAQINNLKPILTIGKSE